MIIIGITGTSGSGKSVFCSALEKCGIPTLDTDKIARNAVKKGTDCLGELAAYFGSGILLENGELDRKKLAGIAFSSGEKHIKLNEITHKYIISDTERLIEEKRKSGAFAISLDVPLLFESGMDKICDVTVAVTAPEHKRIERITKRDGIDEKAAKLRLAAQKSDAELSALCDYTVVNDGECDALENKAKEFAKKISELAKK